MKTVTPQPQQKTPGKGSALGPIAIVAGAVMVAAGGYYYLDRRGDGSVGAPLALDWLPAPSEPPPRPAPPPEPLPTVAPTANVAEGLGALAREATSAGAPGAKAVAEAAARAAAIDPVAQAEPLGKLARSASTALVAELSRQADQRSARMARLATWADPRRPAGNATARQRSMAADLRRARAAVSTAAARVGQAGDPLEAIAAARAALAAHSRFGQVYAQAYTMARAAPAPAPRPPSTTAAAPPARTEPAPPLSRAGLAVRVTEFRQVHNSAKTVAGRVIAMGRGNKPRASDGDWAQAAYRVRRDNAARAKAYTDHLNLLARSLRGAKTDAAARNIVAQARTVRGYIDTLYVRSAAAMPPR